MVPLPRWYTSAPPFRALSFSVSGNVGDHALLERDLLNLTRHLAQVDQHAVDLGYPHEWVPVQQARQRPVRIKLTSAKRLRDGPGFATGGALANPKEGADIRHGQVGLRRPIRKEVDLAQHVDDPARPGARLSRDDWAWSLSAQRSRHALRQLAVFVVQVITTECVCQGRNGLVGRLHALGHGSRGCDFSHVSG